MPNYKTTAEDFKIFQEEVDKWQKILGLLDWQIHTEQQKLNHRASCYTNHSGRIATLTLAVTWDNYGTPPGEQEIRRVAFHEICELLLAPLILCAESRYVVAGDIDSCAHKIIRTLEHVLFE